MELSEQLRTQLVLVELEGIFDEFIIDREKFGSVKDSILEAINASGKFKGRDVMIAVGRAQQRKEVRPGIYRALETLHRRVTKGQRGHSSPDDHSTCEEPGVWIAGSISVCPECGYISPEDAQEYADYLRDLQEDR